MSEPIPPVIEAFIRQLLEPEITRLVAAVGDGRIDIRLSAAKGKVRPRPTLVINGGPSELAEP